MSESLPQGNGKSILQPSMEWTAILNSLLYVGGTYTERLTVGWLVSILKSLHGVMVSIMKNLLLGEW